MQASGASEAGKSQDLARHHRSFGSNVTFGDRRSTMRRVGTATTELSGQHSTGEGGSAEDGETEAADVRTPSANYDSSYTKMP